MSDAPETNWSAGWRTTQAEAFDNFQANSAPEPAVTGCLALAVAVLVRRGREAENLIRILASD